MNNPEFINRLATHLSKELWHHLPEDELTSELPNK